MFRHMVLCRLLSMHETGRCGHLVHGGVLVWTGLERRTASRLFILRPVVAPGLVPAWRLLQLTAEVDQETVPGLVT